MKRDTVLLLLASVATLLAMVFLSNTVAVAAFGVAVGLALLCAARDLTGARREARTALGAPQR